MTEFLKKIFHFSGLFIGLMICLSIILFFIPKIIKTPELRNDNYSEILKSQIIIAGDSRADRCLDPSLVFHYTSLNTINIAQTGHDLYAVSKGLLALNIKNKTIILSASSWQANDGSIQGDYFRIESYGDLSFIEKFYLYRHDILFLYQRQIRQFTNSIKFKSNTRNFYDHNRIINYGFEKISCKDHRNIDGDFFKKHPFYLSPDYSGIKMKLLTRALYNLSLLKGCKILIYNGPVTSAFRVAAKQNGIYNLEVKYDNIMEKLTQNYKNIKYISFIDNSTISDEHFYDPQHLCETGVPIFTKMIADIVKK
jgi:hypothetical protein